MKNEEVVNLFKRYWGFHRLVKRLVIAVEAVLFIFLLYEFASGSERVGFLGLLWAIFWLLFVMSIIYVILISVIDYVMNIVVVADYRYRAIEMLRNQFKRLIRSDFEWVWLVNPGIFSIDCRERFILFSSSETGYVAIRIDGDDILSTKIERDISVSTKTQATHSVDGWSGKGRSDSRSVSVQREGISLEIAYKGSDNLPYVVVVPFGEDRISAERAQYMIQMFA